ncbi:MAG: phosphoribosylaminoimidazolesuccinocarboxamide synthase [Calditrichia bacterium]
MEIKDVLVQGSVKKVYSTNNAEQAVVEFSDTVSANGKKKSSMNGKAELNNAISAYMFEYLESYNVPTHFSKLHDAKSFVAKRLEMIPIVIAVYNLASKELAERFNIEEGKVLEFPIVEMYYKDEKGERPMINEYHAYALGLCDRKDMTSIMRIATKVNAVLKSFFGRKQLQLVSFEIEFGRQNGQVMLADEVSLDTMRLWPLKDNGNFDKIDESKKTIKVMEDLKSRILGS